VNHQPELALFVRLKFEKVIAPPERPELQTTASRFLTFEPRVTEQCVTESLRQFGGCGPRAMHERGDLMRQARQHGGRGLFARQQVGLRIEPDRRHAAADIAADGCRIDQPVCGECHADAYVLGQMHVRQHGNVLDVLRSGHPVQGVLHVGG
jgi:hypothetical protein